MIKVLKASIDTLLNQPVTFKRTLGNALVVYFFDKPGEEKTQLFHLEPSWRYLKDEKIISGSGDIPWDDEGYDSKEAYKEDFERICNLNSSLIGAKLIGYQINEKTFDLILTFEGNQVLQSFTNGAIDYHWIFADTESYYYAYPDRIEKDENAP